MIKTEELRHLHAGIHPNESSSGIGIVKFTATCPNNADEVLERCKEVLNSVLSNSDIDYWPSDQEWIFLLPQWFVGNCAPEATQEEVEQWLTWWRKLSPEEQSLAETESKWSLKDWIYWLVPNRRKWFWWNAKVESPKILSIYFEVEDWPFAWESIAWLLRASGAESVSPE
jgi:hypothetical protein